MEGQKLSRHLPEKLLDFYKVGFRKGLKLCVKVLHALACLFYQERWPL